MRFVKNTLASIIPLMLIACGGGGGGGGGGSPGSNPVTAGVFKDIAVSLPDISTSVQNLCQTGNPYVSTVTPVDLNNDGHADLAVHLWCNAVSGSSVNTQTPDSLVVFIQNNDGTFSNGTQQVFGQSSVSIGGASRKVVVGDINNDGYNDLAFAVNEEDGRAITGNGANQAAKPAIVLSQGNGHYQVVQLGTDDWLHSVALSTNDVGGLDVVFQGFNNVGVQAFRFVSNAVQSVNTYPANISAFTFNFFQNKAITVDVNDPSSLNLMTKANGAWTVSDTFTVPSSQQISFLTWQQSLTTTNLMSFAGTDMVATAFDESCVMKLSPSSNPIVVANLNGNVLSGGYQGGTVNQSNLQSSDRLIGFDTVNDRLTQLNSLFVNSESNYTGNFFDCKDINNDGYQDVVVYPNRSSGLPIVYVNNKQGKLVHYDTSTFPTAPASFVNSSSVMYDFNNDGIMDLLYFPKNVNGVTQFKLYIGTKNI